jgi:hypothetical protein
MLQQQCCTTQLESTMARYMSRTMLRAPPYIERSACFYRTPRRIYFLSYPSLAPVYSHFRVPACSPSLPPVCVFSHRSRPRRPHRHRAWCWSVALSGQLASIEHLVEYTSYHTRHWRLSTPTFVSLHALLLCLLSVSLVIVLDHVVPTDIALGAGLWHWLARGPVTVLLHLSIHRVV